MEIRTDEDAIKYRNTMLKVFPAKEYHVLVVSAVKFQYRVVGSSNFAKQIRSQLHAIKRGSDNGKILLQELTKHPEKIDFVEYKLSHAAAFGGGV